MAVWGMCLHWTWNWGLNTCRPRIPSCCGVTVGPGSIGRLQGVCQDGGLSRNRNWWWQLKQNSWFIHAWFGFISSSNDQMLEACRHQQSARVPRYICASCDVSISVEKETFGIFLWSLNPLRGHYLPPKRRETLTQRHGVTSQKTWIL